MYNELTFGKCLKFFLSTLNLPMSKLARAINVDNSLISLWVSEKRIPSTIYIDEIIEYLLQNITNYLQTMQINELFNSLPTNDYNPELTVREKIHKMLFSSLSYSHVCKEQTKKLQNDTIQTRNKIAEPSWKSIELSCKLIFGFTYIFSASNSLLERAKHFRCTDKNLIYITYPSNLDVRFFTKKRLNYLRV